MTLEEAKKIASIVETAEGGCGGCINEAVKELNNKFPEYVWSVKEIKTFNASVEVRPPRSKEAAPIYRERSC